MRTYTALGALALLSAVAIPRSVNAVSADSTTIVYTTIDDDVYITPSPVLAPKVRPVLMSDPYNMTNTTQLLDDAPCPLNDTLKTPQGLFKFAFDKPSNLSTRRNGTFHNFTDGRDFVYKPVQLDIDIEADIEVEIIVQEFCDICTDRDDPSDFHVDTITTTYTKTTSGGSRAAPTGQYGVMTRELREVTTVFDTTTIWTYDYAFQGSTRHMVKTITVVPTSIVYWEYQYVYVTEEVTNDVVVTQSTQTTVTSSPSQVIHVVTTPGTVTVDVDVTITVDDSSIPTTITYETLVPVTVTKTIEVTNSVQRTAPIKAVTTTPTTTTTPLPAQLTVFAYEYVYITETVYIGGITKVVPIPHTFNMVIPTVVTVTNTVTQTASNGAVVTMTVTATETQSATASIDVASQSGSSTTVVGGTPSVVVKQVSTAVPNTITVIEIVTISIGDRPVTQACDVTKIARPTNDILKGTIRIHVVIVIEIFEFFFFEHGNKLTSTTTTTSTVTVTATDPPTTTGSRDTNQQDSSPSGGVGSNSTTNGTSSTGTDVQTNGTTSLNVTTGGPHGGKGNNGGGSTSVGFGLSYEIDFTVIAIIEGDFFGFTPCGDKICGQPTTDLSSPSTTGSNTSLSTSGGNTPFTFVVTQTGLLVTTTLQIVFFEDLSNPCPVSFGPQDSTEIISIVEDLSIVWIVNNDGSLSCYRNGIQLVFFTCTEVAGTTQLFAGDSASFFDLTVCTEIVLNVNNTSSGGHTPGGDPAGSHPAPGNSTRTRPPHNGPTMLSNSTHTSPNATSPRHTRTRPHGSGPTFSAPGNGTNDPGSAAPTGGSSNTTGPTNNGTSDPTGGNPGGDPDPDNTPAGVPDPSVTVNGTVDGNVTFKAKNRRMRRKFVMERIR